MSIEEKIRDYLANNLGFISKELTLIKKEYRLDNYFGSKGYIDILATDAFKNFVIVEIKRSKASSRETIQEILKYVSLIKLNYRARDSEIRIVILSTDWDELISPFSELLFQTTLTATGYRIFLNNDQLPIRKEEITPVEPIRKRQFAKSYFLDLFRNTEKRETCISYIQNKCIEIGILDYVIIKMYNEKKRNPNLEYPFATCFAFQSFSIDGYKHVIRQAGEELEMREDEFEYQDEFIHYLEQSLIVALNTHPYNDTAEAGYPEKMDSVLGIQEWKVENILRFGAFKSDPRYDDETLLREIRGLDGGSQIKYLNFAESTHIDRIQEIKENCSTPLSHNSYWAKHIGNVFDYLDSIKTPFRIVINVYHPLSLFDTIWRALNTGNNNYLPIYLIFVDFINEERLFIFGGRLTWDGKEINFPSFEDYLSDNTDAFFNKFLDCVQGMHDTEILKTWNLSFENTLAEFIKGRLNEESNIRFENRTIVKYHENTKTIREWLNNNYKLNLLLKVYYDEFTRNF